MKRAKDRTPQRVPRKSSRRGDWRDVLRERLREAINGLGSSNRERAERLGLSDSSRLSEWLSGRVLPNAETLQRIAQVTGASVDWLLGFDVPRDQAARTQVGVIGEALREAILDDPSSDSVAERQRVEDMPAAEIVQAAVAAWWQRRAEVQQRELRQRFNRLAEMMEAAARKPEHVGDARHWLLGQSDEIRSRAWELLRDAPSQQAPMRIPQQHLRSTIQFDLPFPVPYGLGFAYRGKKSDHAWYLDPESLEPTYRHNGRFLTD